MFDLPNISDGFLKALVYVGIAAALVAGFLGFLASIAGLQLSQRADRKSEAQSRLASVEIAKANAAGKRAVQRSNEAKLESDKANAATRAAEIKIADANARLGEAEVRTLEANLRTKQLDVELKTAQSELIKTKASVKRRLINGEDIDALKLIAPECGRGVNVQAFDERDLDSTGFAFSLSQALRYAGIKVNEAWLVPTLQSPHGVDVFVYSPKYAGIENLDKLQNSKLVHFFKERGFLVGGTSNALDQPRGVPITDQSNEMLTPDYCIIVIMPRPPASFGASIFPKTTLPNPKNMELER